MGWKELWWWKGRRMQSIVCAGSKAKQQDRNEMRLMR